MAIELVYLQLGLRIRAIREALGITQDELAKKVRLTRASIANVETGHQRLMLHTIEVVAQALGTTPKHLLKGIWT